MRKIVTEQQTVEVKKQEYIQCDVCKRKALTDDWQGMDFPSELYAFNDVAVSLREGKHYPDCGHGEEIVIDMCPDCFKEKLVVWLKEQGVEVKRKDWDY